VKKPEMKGYSLKVREKAVNTIAFIPVCIIQEGVGRGYPSLWKNYRCL
jgi:hypothetical protein